MVQRWCNKAYRDKIRLCSARTQSQRPFISSIQTKLYDYLDELNVDYHREGPATKIGPYVFDCLIETPGRKLLIEVQGDYWHSLPKAVQRDRSKFTYINRFFPEYEIMYVWEHEFKQKSRVLDRLKLKLGLVIQTTNFSFDEVVVRDAQRDQIKTFLDAYHYASATRNGLTISGWIGSNLIACALLTAPLRQNIAAQFDAKHDELLELARFCIHPSYHKKNFASWFLGKVFRNFKLVVAFADSTLGHSGTIYRAAGLKLHHMTAPDYWYLGLDGMAHHKKTIYNRAIREGITESEYVIKTGMLKRFGGPKYCYLLDRR
jgi:hypothetical protein